MTFQAERRRDLAIQQIERRREEVAARARAAVKRSDEEEIEDVEFKELCEPEAPKKVAESGALRLEEELQAPAAAEEPEASDRMEDAEEHLPSEVGVTMGAKKQRSPRLPLLRRIQRSVRRRRSASMRSCRQSRPRRPTSLRTPRSG
jgi:hypothetical protein